MSLLARPSTPFSRRHDEVEHHGRSRHTPHPVEERALLFGRARGARKPLLALQVRRDLGPVRHAISQRTVAGVMEVHFVFGRDARPPSSGSSESPSSPGSSGSSPSSGNG